MNYHILFDGPPGPPGPTAGRFVEVENDAGFSINAGEWVERPDGFWELVIPDCRAALTAALPFLEQLERSDRVVEVVAMCREALRRAGQ